MGRKLCDRRSHGDTWALEVPPGRAGRGAFSEKVMPGYAAGYSLRDEYTNFYNHLTQPRPLGSLA